MGKRYPKYLFDKHDYGLIRIVNDACGKSLDFDYTRRLYYAHFHPHGIKEMAESRSLRIAYAVAHLLSSLEVGGVDDRLQALRALRSEVIDTAEGPLPKNTARVLLQIMKELVRARGNERRQLELAHDFRMTAFGKPRTVRKQLKRYHLLEMPEEWNQVAFDDHVHDVNTKGRKSSTHLVMDAWIKGIRRLRIVHYNYIEPPFVAELLEAARIMDLDIRIGIEFSARFRDRYIQMMWVPRGFPDSQAVLCFLEEPAVTALMDRGREISRYEQAYVVDLLTAYNQTHRHHLGELFDLELPPIVEKQFLDFVGTGQKAVFHLEKYIHQQVLVMLRQRAGEMRAKYAQAKPEEAGAIEGWFAKMNAFDIEAVVKTYLGPQKNPNLPDPSVPDDSDSVPALLKLSPKDLLNRLAKLHSGFRITLNLTDLQVEDVLELVYDTEGMISRLEMFNLKDWAEGKTAHIPEIHRLQRVINSGNPIEFKQIILDTIDRVKHSNLKDRQSRIEKLTVILHDIAAFRSFYYKKPLKTRIGSDSTGRSARIHGMGLAILETLPPRARKEVARNVGRVREVIPINMTVYQSVTYIPKEKSSTKAALDVSDCFKGWGRCRRVDWVVQDDSPRMETPGNIVTLGGAQRHVDNGLYLKTKRGGAVRNFSWTYLNSYLKNILKVLLGFIPAFLTFALTKDWWLLAYFGAFIWFGITGFRNVLQSVLGGGGLRRSPLLRWNAFVSWDRISDSLLFTGFSVPLLDYLAKTVILDRGFGITTASNPVVLYAVMGLINGVYISSHNFFRGLPKTAVCGNFFRSVLSIPVAIGLNTLVGLLLGFFGVAAVDAVLQKWAAIISKASSDTIAGLIEGLADRTLNIRTRLRDYRHKFDDLLDIYARLELLFPESRAVRILDEPEGINRQANAEVLDLEKIICVHALDLLYFWMYQPRAQSALKQLFQSLSEAERHVLVTSQFTLLRKRQISQLFIDGILGPDFARALSFYLSRYADYHEEMKRFV